MFGGHKIFVNVMFPPVPLWVGVEHFVVTTREIKFPPKCLSFKKKLVKLMFKKNLGSCNISILKIKCCL